MFRIIDKYRRTSVILRVTDRAANPPYHALRIKEF